MRINETKLDDARNPYLIAEIGVNHFDIAEERDITPLDAAKKMVTEAADAGVDAVKFQSYSADSLASKQSPAYWDTEKESTETQYELFDQYDDFGEEEFEKISRWAEKNNDIDFLSTPFDFEAVDYLENLVPAYKIASADITNHPLIRHIARKEKPILLSTGASTIGEIDDAVRVIEEEISDPELGLLHCILQYPTDPENANIGMIEHLDRIYPGYTVGYSDHVPPGESMITLLNSVFHGAQVIEKHFTLNKDLEGNDHYHAMNPSDIRRFKQNMAKISETSGISRKRPISVESDSRLHARRSVVAATDIEAGEEITKDHLTVKRPGTGISPALIDIIIGSTPNTEIQQDTIIKFEYIQ